MAMNNRLKKYIVLDTETCGSIGSPLPYDCGWAVVDRYGNIYRTRNYVVKEVFFGEKELMKSCYYANKLPQYYEDIRNGERIVAKFETIMNRLCEDILTYNCAVITAHNAHFDKRVLENACCHILGSIFDLPSITEMYDTQIMAKETICKLKKYEKFCIENDLLTPTGRIPQNAEALYRFITNDPTFKEAHTGLADVLIEKEILKECLAKHKAMPKKVIAIY